MSSRSSSSLADLSIRGHLPPRGRQRPPLTETTRRSKLKSSTATRKLDWSGNLRPGSVPVTPLWDHNGPLAIESIPIPLSSRGPRVTTPTRQSRVITRANSLTKIDAIESSSRPAYRQMGSQSQTDLGSRRDCSPKIDTDHLQLDQSSDNLDQSVDKMSSEINDILQGINSGLILSDQSILCSNERTEDSINCSSDQTIPSSGNKREDVLLTPHQSVNYSCKQRILQNGFQEPLPELPSLDKETPPLDRPTAKETTAAIKIQRWYRQLQEKTRKKDIQRLLRTKRDQFKAELQQQQSFNGEEQIAMEEKQQRREARMKAARQVAIEKLKKKREEKKRETERAIQEEMALLEAKGKVKKTRTSKQRHQVTSSQQRLEQMQEQEKQEQIQDQPEKREQEIQEQIQDQQEQEQKQDQEKRANTVTLKEEHKPEEVKQDKDHASSEMNTVSEINKESTSQDKLTTDANSPSSQRVDEFFKAGKRKPTPSHSPSSTQHQSSTMDSIFATLKELEKAPPPLPGVQTSPVAVGYLSADNLHKLDKGMTDDTKLRSILAYLDEVESNTQPSTQEEREIAPCSAQQPGDTGQLNEQLEAASAVANDVTTTIVTQRLEIENKNKTVDMLQKALTQQRELTVYHAKEMEKEAQKRLDLQKQEYETTVQRHQCFIDQLIDDKKVLSDKCEQLIKELKETDKKYKTKIATMEDQHAVELEKQKQAYVAAEKLRRERWRTEETQRIKEATVKSLEPEIQRIIARGKAEIQKLKAMHEAELLQGDERASRRFTQQIEEMRVQHAQEKEMACQHERELARQKYEQLAEQEEKSYQQLRRKLYSELQQERDKLSAEMSGHNSALEKQIKELKETHNSETMKLKSEHELAMVELQRAHSVEYRELQERSKIEKQMWEENYLKKQDAILMTREREMRESLRRERDMEIETIIQKLERETATAKEECERAAESRIKRIREKYETELKEVERSERNTIQKFNSMKGQLSDREGEVVKLRSQLKLKEEEVAEINEIATRLTRERDQFADVVRQEFVDRLMSVEEENRHMKLDISELNAKHKLELERHQRGKERELAEVHNRVKQALAKKEENLKTLRTQHEAALKRADHLEMLLEQQRKELLKR